MRVVIFIGYLCFLLLGGGHNFYAGTQQASTRTNAFQNKALVHKVKPVNKELISIVIEDTDFDCEEEHVNNDESQDTAGNTLWSGHYSVIGQQYLSLSCPFTLNYYYKSTTAFPPLLGQTSPIYIKNRVLRI